MKKKRYQIKKCDKYGFVVIGERGEHSIHKTKKSALYRIIKELNGVVEK